MSTTKKKLKYAIVGTSDSLISEIIESFSLNSQTHQLVALFDDSLLFAKKLAKKYQIPYVFSLMDLADEIPLLEIDVLYIAQSSCLDAELIQLIDRYKLHFICESPLYLTLKQTTELQSIMQKNQRRSMIAYHFLFDENVSKIRQNINQFLIGNLKFINSIFNYAIKDENSKRISFYGARTPFYRIGMQCIQLARFLYSDEPYHVGAFSTTHDNPKYINIEDTTCVIMRFSHDRLAAFTISFGSFESSDFEILGDAGRIRCENAYNTKKVSYVNIQTKTRNSLASKDLVFNPRHHFKEEVDLFSKHILTNSSLQMNTLSDAIQNMKILDALIDAINLKKQITINPDGSFRPYDIPNIVGQTKMRQRKIQFEIDRIKTKE